MQESGPTGLLIGHFQGKPVGPQADWALSGQACGIISRQYNFKASLWGPKLTGHFQGKACAPSLCDRSPTVSHQNLMWQHHTKSICISTHTSKQNPAAGSCPFLRFWCCVSGRVQTCRERGTDLQLAAELLDHAVTVQPDSCAHLQAFHHKELEQ